MMNTTKILALFFLLIISFSCEKEVLDYDQPVNSELKSVNGKGYFEGFYPYPPVGDLSINIYPPIVDSRRYIPSVANTVFKGKIWSLSNTTPGYIPTISNSEDGVNWTVVSTVPVHRVSLYQLVVFKDELWVGGNHAPFGASGPNLFKSRDGYHWEPVDCPIDDIKKMFVFQDRLYVLDDYRVSHTEFGHEWSPKYYGFWGSRRLLSRINIVVLRDQLYLSLDAYELNGIAYPMKVYKSDNGIKWRRVTKELPGSMKYRNNFSLTNYWGRLWLVGGIITKDSTPLSKSNEIWFSEDAVSWRKFTGPNPIEPVSDHSATVFKDKLWLFGGNLGFYVSGRPPFVSPTYEISY